MFANPCGTIVKNIRPLAIKLAVLTHIEPGKRFDFEKADPIVMRALELAAADGLKLMKDKAPTLARVVYGWQMNTGTRGVYGNYYMTLTNVIEKRR
jgi:hypothetical protein